MLFVCTHIRGAEHLLLIRTGHMVPGSVPDDRFIESLYGSSLHLCKMDTGLFLSLIQQTDNVAKLFQALEHSLGVRWSVSNG